MIIHPLLRWGCKMIPHGFTPSDVAFSCAVKATQEAKGSRELYARMEQKRPWSERVTPELERFISQQTSFFLGTANAQGQPYIQHRGGPAGFLQVLTDTRLAFADLAGNRQYITLGNLSENQQAYLFLIDYQEARRIKLWGTARVVEDDEALLDQLKMAESKGRPERVILFDLIAWDVNCPQHIPRKMDTDKVSELLAERDVRIADLEARLARRDAR
ncbi:hypothetical protein SAMN04488056_108156 [Cohaesibacter marisflavi]|uniref:Pyridoxamine 5'-phosphate oxidase N-terminal domain-containing protein n=2 Tax=Cohaesibacter marisflavi TaxID=655353 RepID=A0A1I5IBL4_9HYPH|nr:hypothetical protein SAMN04488056_108156 [Cohaesibacter marisflavi]